jgi:hypothetical protein
MRQLVTAGRPRTRNRGCTKPGMLHFAWRRSRQLGKSEERLAAARRQAYVEWLTRVRELYGQIGDALAGNPAPSAESRWRACCAILQWGRQRLKRCAWSRAKRRLLQALGFASTFGRPEVALSRKETKVDLMAWREAYSMFRHDLAKARP